ncbi:MAG TPA: hypothetical protein VG099_32290 [Gemmataceae bacterium]|nr:hypothetical protein [Gemmataceae bacterium]
MPFGDKAKELIPGDGSPKVRNSLPVPRTLVEALEHVRADFAIAALVAVTQVEHGPGVPGFFVRFLALCRLNEIGRGFGLRDHLVAISLQPVSLFAINERPLATLKDLADRRSYCFVFEAAGLVPNRRKPAVRVWRCAGNYHLIRIGVDNQVHRDRDPERWSWAREIPGARCSTSMAN